MKKILSILLVTVMMLSVSVAAFADSSADYQGGEEKFVFKPGSEYTSTDLFENFKNVLPGDSRTQTIEIKNSMLGYYKVRIYLKAVPHSSSNMPAYPTESSHEFTFDTVDEMADFLDCFNLTIRSGENMIYDGSANIGGPDDWILLGELYRGQGTTLTVTLQADKEKLTSEYANKIGEVDWMFEAEEIPYDPDQPRTGDGSHIVLYAALCLASAAAVTGVILFGRKRKNRQ